MYWVVSVTLQRKIPCAADRAGDKSTKTSQCLYTLQSAQSYGRVVSNPITSSYGHVEMSFQVRSHLLDMRISNLLEFFKSVHAFGLWKMAKISVTYRQTDKHTHLAREIGPRGSDRMIDRVLLIFLHHNIFDVRLTI